MRSVNLGRWSRWIERYFNIKGGGGLMDVDPSVVAITSIAEGVEVRYLQGWNRFGVQQNNAAVAAQNGLFKFRNPANSGVIAVIESIAFISGAAGTDSAQLSWGLSTSDLTTLTTLSFTRIDARQAQSSPTIVMSSQTGTPPSILQQFQIPAGGTAQFVTSLNTEYVCLPGFAFQLSGSTVNTAVTASWLWRERPMETSELT